MLKANAKKTASGRKKLFKAIVVAAGCMLVLILAARFWSRTRSAERPDDTLTCWFTAEKLRSMIDRDGCVWLETASSDSSRQQGLSNRPSLDQTRGMLFVFPTQDIQCMWMKDMRFSLDILWLDQQKKITHIQSNISPATYPSSFCASGKYVIEINAGTAALAKLQIGQMLDF